MSDMRDLLDLFESLLSDDVRAPSGTDTPQFKEWFGSSVVTYAGKPLVVYHGSPDARGIWKAGFQTLAQRHGHEENEPYFFFAASRTTAKSYADPHRAWDYQESEPAVIDVYLRIENPMYLDWGGKEFRGTDHAIAMASASGHDGVIISNVIDDYNAKGKPTKIYVVFKANQIKSIKNGGGFSREDDRITEDEATPITVPSMPVSKLPIGTAILLTSGGGFNETITPFVASERGWLQLKSMEQIKGRADSVLRTGGEVISDEALSEDPRKKSLIAKPSWPTINRLYELEALPEGSIVMQPSGNSLTKADGLWDGLSVVYCVENLGRLNLVRYGA